MKVGYAYICQNPFNKTTDYACHKAERSLAELAEPLGFDSFWSVEHHFTDYTMVPDVLQLLSYIAGRTQKIELGSMVVVLPWHDPMRVAEEISLLDSMSDGRFVLGIGRGVSQQAVAARQEDSRRHAGRVEHRPLRFGGCHLRDHRRALERSDRGVDPCPQVEGHLGLEEDRAAGPRAAFMADQQGRAARLHHRSLVQGPGGQHEHVDGGGHGPALAVGRTRP